MSEDRKPPKTPQEKKALSLQKDCRNCYGENAKASRKWIPLRKAGENRKVRRKTAQNLGILPGADDVKADLIESDAALDLERVGGWQKGADMPLGEHIQKQEGRRGARTGRKVKTRKTRLESRQ